VQEATRPSCNPCATERCESVKLPLTILGVCLLALGANAGASTHTVGYVGCFNTSLGVEGYEAVGGASFWVPSGSYHSIPALNYSRGTVLNWQKDGTFFKQFDAFNKDRPASRVWFQVCELAWERNSASSAAALSDLMVIHARGHRRRPFTSRRYRVTRGPRAARTTRATRYATSCSACATPGSSAAQTRLRSRQPRSSTMAATPTFSGRRRSARRCCVSSEGSSGRRQA
jgi:hypothetical protein